MATISRRSHDRNAPRAQPGTRRNGRTDRAGLVEIRVHGVSGTPPESALNWPAVIEVAGDSDAGFYQRATCDGKAEPPEDGVSHEAFSWGHLTSGGRLRALWLLLAPFALVNVAFYAAVVPLGGKRGDYPLPGAPGRGDAGPRLVTRRTLEAALRLLALALTAWSVLAAACVAMDLVGWQYARQPAGSMAGWLRFLHWGWLSQPPRQYAVTALVPLALVIILWALARQTWRVLERTPVPAAAPVDKTDLAPLEDRRMWNGEQPVALLRSVHLLSALCVVAAALVMPLWQPPGSTPGNLLPAVWHRPDGPAVVITGIVIAACLAGTAVVACLPCMTRRERPGAAEKPGMPGLAAQLHWLGVPLVAAAAAVVLHGAYWRSAWPGGTSGPLPGMAASLDVLFAATGLLLLVVAVTAMLLRHAARRAYPEATGPEHSSAQVLGPDLATDPGRQVRTAPAWYGSAPAVLGALGALLMAAGAAGLTLAAARLLGHPATIYDASAATGLIVPTAFYWAAAAATVSTAGALVALLGAPFVLRLRQRPDAELARHEWRSHQLRPEAEAGQARAIGRAWARAGIDAPLRRLLLAALLVTVASMAAATTGYILDPSWITTHLHALATLGILALALAVIGLISLGRQAFSSADARRKTGILWDIASFWPRAAHPLAPPCYMERALPALLQRIETTASTGGTGQSDYREPVPVILSCHSQGTVIGATVVVQLTPEASRNVALLTYGSPLRRIYSLFFPAYFGAAQLERLGDYLAQGRRGHRDAWRWRNLYRPSDMIGGPVLADYKFADTGQRSDVDRWLLDPSFRWPASDVCPPQVHGHSGYLDDPGYKKALNEVTTSLNRHARRHLLRPEHAARAIQQGVPWRARRPLQAASLAPDTPATAVLAVCGYCPTCSSGGTRAA